MQRMNPEKTEDGTSHEPLWFDRWLARARRRQMRIRSELSLFAGSCRLDQTCRFSPAACAAGLRAVAAAAYPARDCTVESLFGKYISYASRANRVYLDLLDDHAIWAGPSPR